MTTSKIVTFGCRLNIFETELMRRHMASAGLEDTVVIHTCAVTAEAERQARQAIRKARRECPTSRIVVTGCSAQIDPNRYQAMAEVDHVLDNQGKLKPATWADLADGKEPPAVQDIMAVEDTAPHLIEGFEQHSRAFVQIQNGCDHRCTFCIIPYGRGNSRSVPVGAIVEQCQRLVDAGYVEIVFTGVDLTSFGKDLPGQPTLGELVRRLLRLVPTIRRLRLSSLDPAEIDPVLFAMLVEDERVMPHVHLSVQAGDDMILKRMKRRHSRQQVVDLSHRLRAERPEIALGADLIAGFPTETEAMFGRSLDLVGEAELTFLHVFPFSPRPGTPAARMPKHPKALAKERAARLRGEGDRALGRFLGQQVGSTHDVLVERGGRGHTRQFAPIRIEGPSHPGTIVPVEAIAVDQGCLLGRIAA
ncbi:MAG: tRNA (N(6)-L-threonylcarbamoyladenosine(37)-C(2))-methylthiotransferase MtaB [Geminicoccaceae bacterium]